MENSATTEILVEMQKTEPTGTEQRSCRKVSFAAPALHKHCYLTLRARQRIPFSQKSSLFYFKFDIFFFSGAWLRHSTRFLTTERSFTTLILLKR